jgi:hypothetical protein
MNYIDTFNALYKTIYTRTPPTSQGEVCKIYFERTLYIPKNNKAIQLTLQIFPNSVRFVGENILPILTDHLDGLKIIADEHGLTIRGYNIRVIDIFERAAMKPLGPQHLIIEMTAINGRMSNFQRQITNTLELIGITRESSKYEHKDPTRMLFDDNTGYASFDKKRKYMDVRWTMIGITHK